MTHESSRRYHGPLKAVILDWAGTTIDHGCIAPVFALIQLFEMYRVPITLEQARGPMGVHKRDHIRTILGYRDVRERWQLAYGAGPTGTDVHAMFDRFLPLQLRALTLHGKLISGTVEATTDFRRRGLKIGTTTGYTREMMRVVLSEAARQGYVPDFNVAVDEVSAGRPYPWMCFKNAEALGVFPPEAMVKVGDTVPDIEEGLNAGAWTVGVSMTGNEVGVAEEQLIHANDRDLANRRSAASKLRAAGAHYVVDSIRELHPVLDLIDKRLQEGDRP
jgi:phosphonoacetaldehyde hydrolase